jgi:hypothetical protein
VKKKFVEQLKSKLFEDYLKITNKKCEFYETEPCDGAGFIDLTLTSFLINNNKNNSDINDGKDNANNEKIDNKNSNSDNNNNEEEKENNKNETDLLLNNNTDENTTKTIAKENIEKSFQIPFYFHYIVPTVVLTLSVVIAFSTFFEKNF